jgi:hypothetical protein
MIIRHDPAGDDGSIPRHAPSVSAGAAARVSSR